MGGRGRFPSVSCERGTTIAGWRTYDPLRKCLASSALPITVEHVVAADRLRQLADGCAIGFSCGRELMTVQGIPAYLPRTGFGDAAVRTAQAWPAYRRAMQPFCVAQRALIARVILANWSVRRWCTDCQEREVAVTPAIEMGRLLSILDALVEHFKTEIERDIGHSAVV